MRKTLLLIGTIAAAVLCSSSCNKDDDNDAIQCGRDSCLIRECKNHPSDSWVYEHCYDYEIYPMIRPTAVRRYFRQNKDQMETNCAAGKALNGTMVRTIKHEYDIWNRTNNVDVIR